MECHQIHRVCIFCRNSHQRFFFWIILGPSAWFSDGTLDAALWFPTGVGVPILHFTNSIGLLFGTFGCSKLNYTLLLIVCSPAVFCECCWRCLWLCEVTTLFSRISTKFCPDMQWFLLLRRPLQQGCCCCCCCCCYYFCDSSEAFLFRLLLTLSLMLFLYRCDAKEVWWESHNLLRMWTTNRD